MRGGDEMMELEYIPVECATCGHVTNILGAPGIRPWKLFERDCAKCEGVCMTLAERNNEKKGK